MRSTEFLAMCDPDVPLTKDLYGKMTHLNSSNSEIMNSVKEIRKEIKKHRKEEEKNKKEEEKNYLLKDVSFDLFGD